MYYIEFNKLEQAMQLKDIVIQLRGAGPKRATGYKPVGLRTN